MKPLTKIEQCYAAELMDNLKNAPSNDPGPWPLFYTIDGCARLWRSRRVAKRVINHLVETNLLHAEIGQNRRTYQHEVMLSLPSR